jgi:integral membrane protein
MLQRLRFVALLEGISFLVLLLVAMPLKYLANLPEPVRYVGMAHGLLFVLYCLMVVQCGVAFRWTAKKIGLALVASMWPFGTFWADKHLFRGAYKNQAGA